jgi:DNA-binding NarL/FixJ family response regulator
VPDVIRVLVVDDHELVRAALRRTLGQHTDLAVAGTAADGARAVASAAELRPDVVLMDVRMPGMTGIEACRRIVAAVPGTRVLMLTTFDHDEYVHDALRAGAAGFVLKNAPTARLVDAVREVAAGGSVLAPTVTRRLIDTVTTLPPAMLRPPAPDVLTPRERAVLRLLATGLSNRAIARQLALSESSVKSTVNRILTRLGLENRVQAALLAHQYLSGPP